MKWGKNKFLLKSIQFLLHLKLKYLIFHLTNEQMKKFFLNFFYINKKYIF